MDSWTHTHTHTHTRTCISSILWYSMPSLVVVVVPLLLLRACDALLSTFFEGKLDRSLFCGVCVCVRDG